ncbi:MAG: pyridoxamine 5'-phosphate oxidase family protein [Erysipelotrichaceae bacterium]|nr:pyridoxamine 5'-phosphate oxidase family protein [Erysipelotrichaceae bacterium]
MNEVLEYLKKCKTFYIATMDKDQPRVRPFGVAEEYEGKIYIQTGKVKNVSKQMAINPKIEICACAGPTWLRIEGEAVNDDRREVKAYVLDQNPGLKGMYSADDNTQVLYLKNAKATFYSFTDAPRVVEF